MQDFQTTLATHEPKAVTTSRGQSTLHIFKSQDGRFECTTFEKPLADKAYLMLNQPVIVTVDVVQKNGTSGTFTNYYLKDIRPAAAGMAAPSPSAPTDGAAPSAAPATQAAPAPSDLTRQLQIMRQSAIKFAAECGQIAVQLIPEGERTFEAWAQVTDAVMTRLINTPLAKVGAFYIDGTKPQPAPSPAAPTPEQAPAIGAAPEAGAAQGAPTF